MSEHTLSGSLGFPSPLSGRCGNTSHNLEGSQLHSAPARHLHRADSDAPAFGSGMTSGGPAPDSPKTADGGPSDSGTSDSGTRGRSRRPRRRTRRAKTEGVDPKASENQGSTETPEGEDAGERSPRPRRRTRRRPAAEESAVTDADSNSFEAQSTETDEAAAEDGDGGQAKRSRRRGRRGGRRRRKSEDEDQSSSEAETQESRSPEPSSAPAGDADEGAEGRSKSRRYASKRGRGGRGKAKRSAETSENTELDAGEEEPKKLSRKRGSRGGRGRRKSAGGALEIESIPFEEDDLPQLEELPEDAVLLNESSESGARSKRTKRSKKSKTRRKGARDEEEDDDAPAVQEPLKNRQILVNAGDPEETRVTVVEDGRIVELFMTVKKQKSYVSDIYRGRVVNIESAIGAAFVDFGQGKNGFLHASDVLESYGDPDWDLEQLLSTPVDPDEETHEDGEDGEEEEDEAKAKKDKKGSSSKGRGRERNTRRARTPIDKLVKKGQMVAVQITKDAIGDKGPTLTTYVSIPGRYLVLMPSLERTGVSRKIEDEKERRRLKRILTALKIPDGMGVIVRTAGVGKTKAELKRDLDYLLLAWDDFAARLKGGRNPTALYQESDVAIRTMRDLFTTNTEVVIVDDEQVHKRMVEFTERLMPEYVDRIKRHEGVRPILQSHGVEQDFEKIFQRRVELPSGGSIVIDQTEALVAIDVNSGRTREAGAEFEDIALKTNLEAVAELSRQIRLRDLGGIIVLDYIDMMRASSRRAVETATREAFKDDRARSKIGRISQFGLLELTRQRLGPGLTKLVYDSCTRCKGSGRRRNASSRAQSILRRLGASLVLKGFSSVEVRAHPEVIEYLQRELPGEIKQLEEASGRTLILMAVPDQAEDSVLHYKRADGREVRPGGRRKR